MAAPWDCMSCGAHAETKPYCEQCGAAMPVEGGEDSALSLMLGLVCERCDGYNDPGVAVCSSCRAPLGDAPSSSPSPTAPAADPSAPPSWMTPPTGQPQPQLLDSSSDGQVPAKAPPGRPSSASEPPKSAPGGPEFALPRIDLAEPARAPKAGGHGVERWADAISMTALPAVKIATAAPPAILSQQLPAQRAPACLRCGTSLSADDKFCRNCGARAGDAPPMVTTQIGAVKMPAPGAVGGPGATLVMPAMRQANGPAPSPTMFFGAATAERTAKLVLVRGQSQFGSQWRLQSAETVIGRSVGAVLFPDDETMAARHCKLVFRGGDLWLEPDDTTNGVFVRVREPVRLAPDDEIVVGAQRLKVLANVDRPQLVASPDDTRILGSLVKPAPPIMLLRMGDQQSHNEVFHRHQRLLTVGRNNCDVNFPKDSFVSERHAQLTHDDQGLMLEDLRSRNGTYLRARHPLRLVHGDLVLLGDKVLRVELPR